MTRKFLFMLFALAGSLLVMAGCSGPQVRSTSPEDNPEHHYLVGMNALENGNLQTAQEKFERAIYLDEEFSRAHAGLAILSGEKVKGQPDAQIRNMEAQKGFESLKKARKYADRPEEEFDAAAATIRLNTLVKSQDWLEEAREAHYQGQKLQVDERSLIYYQGAEALTYYMGIAYLEALQFQKARDSFGEVLSAKREGKWHEKADRGWKKADKIVRAMAGLTIGDVGKKIAVKDAVTRADLAALLIDEMKLEKLLAGRIATAVQPRDPEFVPADLVNHPFRTEALTMMKWKVRGMEPKYDALSQAYLFRPSDSVSRSEFAFMLEDVLIKLAGDEKLATAYFGQDRSPFPDVRPTAPYYNAVMNVTTRGIMEGELSGEFRPAEPVTGADALLAIRMLNQKKNIY